MRLGGGGVSPSVEARNFTDRGGLLPCPTWGHSLATVLMLGVLWSGLAACMLGALSYDIAYWFGVRETHSKIRGLSRVIVIEQIKSQDLPQMPSAIDQHVV